MEILDLYDNNGKLLNKTVVRGTNDFGENENIKVVTIWIKCNDKFLIQKTSQSKGGNFAVTGGHIPSGKTTKQQAIIELFEELALKVDENDLQYLGTLCGNHKICDVFMYENDNLANYPFVLQKEEVESIHWFSKEEFARFIETGTVRKTTIHQFKEFINKH